MAEKSKLISEFVSNNSTLEEDDKILTFSKLYGLNKNNVLLEWYMCMSIIYNNKHVDIQTDHYYDHDYTGEYWTVSGQVDGKKITSETTKVSEGKNLNKKNETTPITQIYSEIYSQYQKKIKQGYAYDKNSLFKEVKSIDDLFTINKDVDTPWRVNAMLLHALSQDDKKNWNRVSYPCYVQPKLDGVLTILVYHPNIPHNEMVMHSKLINNKKFINYLKDTLGYSFVDANVSSKKSTTIPILHIDKFSRTKETIYSCNHITLLYALVAKDFPGLYLVGEMYKNGTSLQDINSIVSKKDDNAEHDNLDFWVFDCFYIGRDLKYVDRLRTLNKLIKQYKDLLKKLDLVEFNANSGIKFVETTLVKNRDDILAKFKDYTENKKLEGVVIRNKSGTYEYGLNSAVRVYTTLKLKARYDDEWPIVDFKSGKKGKEEKSLIWICAKKSDNIPLDKRKTFSVSYNKPIEFRNALFKLFTENPEFFKKNVYGKEITINYSILSDDNVPLQPKAIRFKDTNVDILLEEVTNKKIGGDDPNTTLTHITQLLKNNKLHVDYFAEFIKTKFNNQATTGKINTYLLNNDIIPLLTEYFASDNTNDNTADNGNIVDDGNIDVDVNIGTVSIPEIEKIIDNNTLLLTENILVLHKYNNHNHIYTYSDLLTKDNITHKYKKIIMFDFIKAIEDMDFLCEYLSDVSDTNCTIYVFNKNYIQAISNYVNHIDELLDYLNISKIKGEKDFNKCLEKFYTVSKNYPYTYADIEKFIDMFGIYFKLSNHKPSENFYPGNIQLIFTK